MNLLQSLASLSLGALALKPRRWFSQKNQAPSGAPEGLPYPAGRAILIRVFVAPSFVVGPIPHFARRALHDRDETGEVPADGARGGVIGAEGGLRDRQGTRVEGAGRRVVPLRAQQGGQVVEA